MRTQSITLVFMMMFCLFHLNVMIVHLRLQLILDFYQIVNFNQMSSGKMGYQIPDNDTMKCSLNIKGNVLTYCNDVQPEDVE